MSATASLLTEIKGNSAIAAVVGDEVYYNHIPEDKPNPYIWFATSGLETAGVLGPDSKIMFRFIDLECVADSQKVADDLAEVVIEQLGATPAGAFGDGHIAGIEVTDQTDDYIPKNLAADSGMSVAAINMQLILYEE